MEKMRTPEEIINGDIAARIGKNPERAKKIGGVYEFVLEGENGGTWHLDLNAPKVATGPAPKMDVRLRMKADDFVAIVEGRLNEMQAFTQGKLKVEGNIAMALKLRQVLSPQGW